MAAGSAAAGIQKSWKAGDRTGLKGKIRGVARVTGKTIVSPITAPTKLVGKTIKSQYQSGKENANYGKTKNLNVHSEMLNKKIIKHKLKQEKLKNKGKAQRRQERHFKKSEKAKTERYRQGYDKHD